MKRFTTIALVVLVALATLIVPASAANSVEVRGTVYNGSSLDNIIATSAAGNDTLKSAYIEMTPQTFAGFFYDIDDDTSTESLKIYNYTATDGDLVDGRTISKNGVVYNTSIALVNYSSPNLLGQYNVLGLFAEKYIPLKDTTPDKLGKLLLDEDQKYTLRTGSALDLGDGYAVTAKQVDVDGKKVWMELTKDGEFVEDEVLDLTNGAQTWDYQRDGVAGEDDVSVFKVNVTDVFQGQVDSLAVIDGVWLMDYSNILEIQTDDTFGDLKVKTVGTNYLTLKNDNSITLTKNKKVSIAEGLYFQTADSDDVRFFLMKEYTAAGTYDVRGSVSTGTGGATPVTSWDYSNFAGFFYDLDDNISTEVLTILQPTVSSSSRTIDKDNLTYTTTIASVDYASPNLLGQYDVLGLFAEKYIPLKSTTPDKLGKLLLDEDQKYTLRTGSALDLGDGYAVTAKQVDVDGKKVWMELTKDGEFVEDEVLDLTNGAQTWDYQRDGVAGEDDVSVFKVNVTDVFQGQVDSLAVIDGVWLMDYSSILEIQTDDTFGDMKVKTVGTSSLTLKNDNSITLTKNKDIDIAEGMKFKTADSDTLRFYPFVEKTIGESTTGTTTEPTVTEPTTEQPTENVTEQPTENVTEQPTTEQPTTEQPTTEQPTTNDTGTEQPSPGFEAVFAVAGLLAVAYLVRRN
ncbi:S-layer family duplication domain-containing protein [Methanolobus vulcani]|uniref:S-layer family duplication domain-containing protein n=1 Tax=Methanolobus vulcani TaxID=38026 RepID=A0A7Z7AZ13_9EURY|nr:S-layer protein domain-containing protein [Methanolobus vulcani]SDG30471.1 S-layer family duplication domain-containing protein [Methanolobus vulcani]